jgi:hypothetical protein
LQIRCTAKALVRQKTDVAHLDAARQLFGLKGMAPLAAAVRPPYRPQPGRGRGRPPLIVEESALPPEPLPPLTSIERRAFDYSDLEQSMAQLDLVLRETRRSLDGLTRGASAGAGPADPL